MRSLYLAFIFTFASGTFPAASEEWRKFIIPSTGASAEIPISSSSKKPSCRMEGSGVGSTRTIGGQI